MFFSFTLAFFIFLVFLVDSYELLVSDDESDELDEEIDDDSEDELDDSDGPLPPSSISMKLLLSDE